MKFKLQGKQALEFQSSMQKDNNILNQSKNTLSNKITVSLSFTLTRQCFHYYIWISIKSINLFLNKSYFNQRQVDIHSTSHSNITMTSHIIVPYYAYQSLKPVGLQWRGLLSIPEWRVTFYSYDYEPYHCKTWPNHFLWFLLLLFNLLAQFLV